MSLIAVLMMVMVVVRFWLLDCPQVSECTRLSTELYQDVIAVPFVSQVVVFAKRRSMVEAHLRVYCVTDDRLDKTLETREHYREVARSRGIEVTATPRYDIRYDTSWCIYVRSRADQRARGTASKTEK